MMDLSVSGKVMEAVLSSSGLAQNVVNETLCCSLGGDLCSVTEAGITFSYNHFNYYKISQVYGRYI